MAFSSGEVLTAANLNALNITSATLTTTATTSTELLRLEGAWSTTNRMAWISGVTTTDDGVLARIGLGTDPTGANNNDGAIVFQTTSAANTTGSTLVTAMTIDDNSNVVIAGSLSKGSGSFDIQHPTKGDAWRLRHSFIEGPQADLIYRGTVTLVNGSATVDLDEKAGMTDGTWLALCRDPWSMASSSGNIVEWVLNGKTLTITSATLDAVCPWIVMAERQDDHMASKDNPMTGPAGDPAVITEYETTTATPE